MPTGRRRSDDDGLPGNDFSVVMNDPVTGDMMQQKTLFKRYIFADTYTYAYSKANLVQAVAGVRMDDREMRTVREALDALGLENSRRDVNAVFVRMSDDFYHYNIIADDIRQFVNGQRVIDEEWAHLVRRMADINSNNVNN
jgi:hypothetical protein